MVESPRHPRTSEHGRAEEVGSVLGGLGNMVGAFIAAFIMSEILSVGGVLWSTEMGYVGIHVTRFKLGVTVLSAVLTAVGGVAYARYISYVSPDTLSGIGVSLRIVFAVVLGGMYSLLGPTVGTAPTVALAEYLRVVFGVRLIGMAETVYGLFLILFIVFLASGICGSLRQLVRRRARPVLAPAA